MSSLEWNLDWKFYKKEAGLKEENYRIVNLPHDAMLEETRSYTTPNGDKTGYYPGGSYVYEKSLFLSEEDVAQYVAVKFDGVYGKTDVYLNDVLICTNHYGYNAFTANLIDHCKTGENTIRVNVDNTLVPNSRWYSGAGIYREVSLIKKPILHLSDLRIITKSIHPAIVDVDFTYDGENVQVYIFDSNKELVATGTKGEIEIIDAKLWSAKTPNLYTCKVTSETDCIEQTFGIRMISWSATDGLCINGETIKLQGGCIHHDNGVLGACAFRDAEYRKVRILKENGYNAIRSSHNPCSKELLDACDELGMYVLDEAFDGWYIPKNYHDNSRVFWENYKLDLKSMVDRDYSHPSVIMYSIGNEVTEIVDEKGIELCKDLVSCVKKMDSSRPVTCGLNIMLAWMAKRGQGLYKDVNVYEAKPLDDLENSPPKAGSEFFNNLMQKIGSIMDGLVKTKTSCKIVDAVADIFDIVGYNYGQQRYDLEAKTYPDRIILGTETLVEKLAYNWQRVEKNTSLIGDFCWTAFDYIGEAGLGAWRYESDHRMPYLAGCGAIDITGIPTVESAYQRVIWGQEKIGIGVRPVHMADEKVIKRSWSFTNAIESWNFKECGGKKAIVEVYTKDHLVKLFINGRLVGKQKPKDAKCIFKCRYEKGELTAVSYDENENEIARKTLSSGEGKVHFRIMAEQDSIRADGHSLCYMFVEAVDDSGMLCPTCEDEIEVKVSGDAVLCGIGTSRPYSDISFGQMRQKLYQGRCQIVLRAGLKKGSAEVKVEGFENIKCKIELK